MVRALSVLLAAGSPALGGRGGPLQGAQVRALPHVCVHVCVCSCPGLSVQMTPRGLSTSPTGLYCPRPWVAPVPDREDRAVISTFAD